MSVRLHIDRLVVEGLSLSRGDRVALAAAVEGELARRLRAEQGAWPESGAAVRSVSGSPLRVAPGRPVAALGTEIAGSIHAGLTTAVGR
jgi:hypothetical protein